jgi:hypothetical protein
MKFKYLAVALFASALTSLEQSTVVFAIPSNTPVDVPPDPKTPPTNPTVDPPDPNKPSKSLPPTPGSSRTPLDTRTPPTNPNLDSVEPGVPPTKPDIDRLDRRTETKPSPLPKAKPLRSNTLIPNIPIWQAIERVPFKISLSRERF